ncbi:MAG: prepilin-type N-terminal cleavage/methylation domain-containing protein [Candidatus Xenobiia bacterium LiM19]
MRRRQGFTLVEAMVTMFLIALMVVALLNVFPRIRKGSARSEVRMNAAFLGKSLMDTVRSNGFNKAASSSGTMTFSGLNNGNSTTQKIDYSINVQTLSSNKKQVWIILSWNDAVGKGRLTMETIMVKL